MRFRRPEQSDWDRFLALATVENWRVPLQELQLFRGGWAAYAHVLDDGGFRGLGTAVSYERSAWIGNLIVPADWRGLGYGTALFRHLLDHLQQREVESVWLTASDQGIAIYEKAGFVVVDQVERWVRPAQQGVPGGVAPGPCHVQALVNAEQSVWGESRSQLLRSLCRSGHVVENGGEAALLQGGKDVQILGPWYSSSGCSRTSQELVSELLSLADSSVDVVVDMLKSSSLQCVCESHNFTCVGKTALMAYGDTSHVRTEQLISLASPGSIG